MSARRRSEALIPVCTHGRPEALIPERGFAKSLPLIAPATMHSHREPARRTPPSR